jgi:hypothetical protein
MTNKRVFVAFVIEDETTKNLFTGQAKNENVPYDFVDISVKEPWYQKLKRVPTLLMVIISALFILNSCRNASEDKALYKAAKESKVLKVIEEKVENYHPRPHPRQKIKKTVKKTCPSCAGYGKLYYYDSWGNICYVICTQCSGKGYVFVDEWIWENE